jgi:hypothetical protein
MSGELEFGGLMEPLSRWQPILLNMRWHALLLQKTHDAAPTQRAQAARGKRFRGCRDLPAI